MSGRARVRPALLAGLAVLLVTLSGRGSDGVTPAPLQASMAQAFSHLYVQQQVALGNARTSLDRLHTKARCRKGTPATVQQGAGSDWLCAVTYLVAGPATPVVARYTVTVQTNGCYSADGDGPASVNGARTITGPRYEQVINPLRLIDGCFPLD